MLLKVLYVCLNLRRAWFENFSHEAICAIFFYNLQLAENECAFFIHSVLVSANCLLDV